LTTTRGNSLSSSSPLTPPPPPPSKTSIRARFRGRFLHLPLENEPSRSFSEIFLIFNVYNINFNIY
jgi:hypothetical protein